MVKRYCWSPDGMETSGYNDIDMYVFTGDYAALRELADELRVMIIENEFAAEIHGESVCVECYEYPKDGHAKGCKLVLLLAKYEQFIKEQDNG